MVEVVADNGIPHHFASAEENTILMMDNPQVELMKTIGINPHEVAKVNVLESEWHHLEKHTAKGLHWEGSRVSPHIIEAC